MSLPVWLDLPAWADGPISQADLNWRVVEPMLYLYNRVQGGTVTITPSAANSPTSVDVSFLVPFLSRPYVFISYHGNSTGVGTNQVRCVAADHESETGFRATLTRNGLTSTSLNWIAVQQ